MVLIMRNENNIEVLYNINLEKFTIIYYFKNIMYHYFSIYYSGI